MTQIYKDKDIIDIIGLCNPDRIDLSEHNFWTQILISENLIIPKQKPNIEQVNSVKIKAKVIKKKVIVTPKSKEKNEEGKKLTGRKLVVEGELIQAVTYTADLPEQSLHTAHFVVPFSAFIVMPSHTGLNDNFDINICIEDVFVKNFSSRQIFKDVTLFLQAVPVLRAKCIDNC